jgi:hypothetical protein
MRSGLVAVPLGALGGLLLVVAGAASLLAGGPADWRSVLADVGYAVTVVALAATGYALVARAPVWLRIIVLVALPLLAASVWQVVDQAIDDRVDGWQAAATSHLVAGVVVLAGALLGLRRTATAHDRGPTGSPDR